MAEQQVKVRNLDTGELGTVPASQAAAAIRSGSFEQVSGEEYRKAEIAERRKGLGQTALAGIEGIGRGASFGGTDYLARKLAPEYANEMAERKEAHPIVSTTGEIAGAVAPVLLSGGTGAVAKGASLAPTSLAARLGEGAASVGRAVVGEGAPSLLGRMAQRAVPMAAQGATEGALYGAGQAVSEAALGDEQLTAERLVAGMKGGALAGLIGGGTLGAGLELGKYAGQKALAIVGETGLRDFFQSVADKSTIRALGASARDVRAMGGMAKSAEKMEERIASISDEVRSFQFKNGEKLFGISSTTDKLAEALPRARSEVGAELGQLRSKVAGLIEKDASLAPDVSGFLQRVESQVLEPMRLSALPEMQARALKVEGSIAELRRMAAQGSSPVVRRGVEGAVTAKPVTIEQLTKVRQDIDRFLYPKSKAGLVIPPEHQAELLQVNRMLEETIEEATEKALEKAGDKAMLGKYTELKDKFRNLSDASRIVQDAEARSTARNAVSLSDKMAGIGGFAGTLATGVGGVPALGAALVTGGANRLANTYGNQAAALAFNRLARISHASAEADRALTQGVKAFFEGAKTAAFKTAVEAPVLNPRPALAARTPEERYEQASGELSRLMTAPERAFDRVAQHVAPIAPEAPKVAANVANIAMTAAQALEKRRPVPSRSAQVALIPAPASPPDDAARAKFLRHMDGADPQTVIKLIKQGRLTKDEMDIHKEVLPRLYEREAELFTEEAIALGAKGKDLSYEKKIQASIFLGTPLDPTLTPAFIRTVQAMHKANGGGGQSQQAQASNAAPKRQLDIAGSYETASDRIGGLR